MRKSLGLLLCLLLWSCASNYSYRPESGQGAGLYHKPIEQNLYRVHYKSLDDNKVFAKQQALQHAASLTLQQQLDWFVVIEQQTITEQLIDPNGSKVSRLSCNQQSCQQETYDQRSFRAQFKPDEKAITTEVVLQIRMGKGMRPHGKTSYDARQLHSTQP